jgi:rRNA maturation protein Nop10
MAELDGRKAVSAATIHAMAREFQIDKLSDEFGQYTLILTCDQCGHERIAQPAALGRLCGWDTRLADVAKRMRCSKCGTKQCSMRAVPPRKPRGYKSLPN